MSNTNTAPTTPRTARIDDALMRASMSYACAARAIDCDLEFEAYMIRACYWLDQADNRSSKRSHADGLRVGQFLARRLRGIDDWRREFIAA